jgi:flavin reductase (DIM6/NTAB) family NADH-FMN oxidoreductase RutF
MSTAPNDEAPLAAADLGADAAAQAVPPVTALFRRAFRSHPGGLAIISADVGDGPAGILSSSLASVSTDPAALSFTVSTLTASASVVRAATTFVVHMLDSADLALAKIFATPGSARFGEDMQWERLPTGEPYLVQPRTRLRCRAIGQLQVGTSLIVAGEVLDGVIEESSALPLVYVNRAFHVFHEFPIR